MGMGRGLAWYIQRTLLLGILVSTGLAGACVNTTSSPPEAKIAPASGLMSSSSPAEASAGAEPEPLAADPAPPVWPNVVLVTMDTLRADALGAYGNPNVRTPVMDSLAREGTRFNLAITPLPQTNPTHASIFTGMFSQRHGLVSHMGSFLSPDVKPIAQILSEDGYKTAGHHSWISFDPEYSGLERGFDSYERHTVDRPWNPDDKPDFYEQYLDSRANVTTDGVLSWLQQEASDPFFLWVHYNDAHWPYDPPAPFDTMFDQCDSCPDGSMETIIRIAEGYSPAPHEVTHLRALYDGEVAFEDQQLGRVVSWLREQGRLDNTVFVLTADHGEGFGERGLWSHQTVLYNTAARIPLIIRYPRLVPAGGLVQPAVSSIDILPTILGILGVPTPAGVQGQSLLPLIRSQETGQEREVFSQLWDGGKSAIIYRGMKLINDREAHVKQLFDIGQDLAESHDLAQERPDVLRDLDARLQAWLAEQGLSP